MKDIDTYLKLVKTKILEEIKNTLKDENKEIYVHDIITEIIDSSVPSRKDAIDLIDYLKYEEGIREEYIDGGLLDTSSLDRFIATHCYAMLEDYVYNDDFINSLQNIEEQSTKEQRVKWIKKINRELKKYKTNKDKIIEQQMKYMDTENQIWIKKTFPITVDDFKDPYFTKNQITESQIVDLHDAIKILTNSYKPHMSQDTFMREMNKNALVIEHPDRDMCRIYLMEKSPDLDIRKLFRYMPKSIKDADYDLNPETYIQGKLIKKYTDKSKFMETITRVSQELVRMQSK